jgi:CubicO group peptidase (beta-lactamase class C family)
VTHRRFAARAAPLLAPLLLAVCAAPPPAPGDGAAAARLAQFEQDVDELRNRLMIPGLSVAVVQDQRLAWARGFGFADLENRVPATPDTLYSIASLTKTFAATLVMQLVERGQLDLDEPASHYSADFKDDTVRIKHLISHTSAGTPGERFEYDGNRYDYLTAVIEKKTGQPFVKLVVDSFFEPLGMALSVPYHDVVVDADRWRAALGAARLARYEESLARLAQPYSYYGAGEIVHASYPPREVGAAAGLLSTVSDLARYDIAIDRHLLIQQRTQEQAWTPFVSNAGQPLPYGLGWFVTDHHGQRLVWHYGQWGMGFSALYVKMPARNVSMIMLANSEALAANGGENLVGNAFVCSFLRFVGEAGGCRSVAEAALVKWLAERRAAGRVAMRVDPALLDRYVGQYLFEALDNRIFTISREGDRFFAQGTQSPKLELFAESPSLFFVKIRPYVFVFSTPEGQPAELTIVQDQYRFASKRLR